MEPCKNSPKAKSVTFIIVFGDITKRLSQPQNKLDYKQLLRKAAEGFKFDQSAELSLMNFRREPLTNSLAGSGDEEEITCQDDLEDYVRERIFKGSFKVKLLFETDPVLSRMSEKLRLSFFHLPQKQGLGIS